MAKMRWKKNLRSQIDRKKFVFNVISRKERGSSGLLGWLRDGKNAMKAGLGDGGERKWEKTLLLCVCIFWDFVVIWIYQVFALSLTRFPYVLCVERKDRSEDAKKRRILMEPLNGKKKKINSTKKRCVVCSLIEKILLLVIFFLGVYVINVINCIF